MKTILCYGDSNTWGYNAETTGRYPPETRWPNVMARELGDGYTVIPEGLNCGMRSMDGSTRLSMEAGKPFAAYRQLRTADPKAAIKRS